MVAAWDIKPWFKAVEKIGAFETLHPGALNCLHVEAIPMFFGSRLFFQKFR